MNSCGVFENSDFLDIECKFSQAESLAEAVTLAKFLWESESREICLFVEVDDKGKSSGLYFTTDKVRIALSKTDIVELVNATLGHFGFTIND